MNRKVVRVLLQNNGAMAARGVEIEEAEDGGKAVEAVRRVALKGDRNFDFIFMDYIMVRIHLNWFFFPCLDGLKHDVCKVANEWSRSCQDHQQRLALQWRDHR